MNDFASNVMVIPTHNDILGVSAKTKAQIVAEMLDYSSYAILHECTKLMLLLNSDEGNSPEA